MFVIDSNVLIEAKNRYYAFDIAPGFWAWLDQAYSADLVCSIKAVADELLKGEDELAKWVQGNQGFFRAVDEAAVQHFPELTDWATSRDFNQSALNDFTGNNADYLLVAYARAHGHTVVTLERPQPQAKSRVLIPDACQAMGVETTDTFGMLRQMAVELHIDQWILG